VSYANRPADKLEIVGLLSCAYRCTHAFLNSCIFVDSDERVTIVLLYTWSNDRR